MCNSCLWLAETFKIFSSEASNPNDLSMWRLSQKLLFSTAWSGYPACLGALVFLLWAYLMKFFQNIYTFLLVYDQSDFVPCRCDECTLSYHFVLCRCDECTLSYHFVCLDPPMKKTPKQRGYSWHCAACDPTNDSVSYYFMIIIYIY